MRSETKTLRFQKKTPGYKLMNQESQFVAQHHFTGHTHSILYFLQSVHNPRCRDYCQQLGRHLVTAAGFKTTLVAIAPESVEELARAHSELVLPFPLLSDTGSVVAGRYGLVEKKWFRPARVTPAVIVHDKYGIAHSIAVAEQADERPAWPEIEATLRRFPRG